jgi:DNA gyrase/topoisomerase IV subunit A
VNDVTGAVHTLLLLSTRCDVDGRIKFADSISESRTLMNKKNSISDLSEDELRTAIEHQRLNLAVVRAMMIGRREWQKVGSVIVASGSLEAGRRQIMADWNLSELEVNALLGVNLAELAAERAMELTNEINRLQAELDGMESELRDRGAVFSSEGD